MIYWKRILHFQKNKIIPNIKEERNMLMEMYPKIGEAKRLKHLFHDFWDIADK